MITGFAGNRSSPVSFNGADDEARTRDPQLGRLMLYQLSYVRISMGGGDRIRTYSGIANRFTVCPVSPTSAHPLKYMMSKRPVSSLYYLLDTEPVEGLPAASVGINFSSLHYLLDTEPVEGLEPPTS